MGWIERDRRESELQLSFAMNVLSEELERHVASAHPEDGRPCDLVCDRCRQLLARQDAIAEDWTRQVRR